MNKIFLILKREFITRVKKRSFLIMTILSPLLIVLFYGITIYFTINGAGGEDEKSVFVNDTRHLITDKLSNNKIVHFEYGSLADLTPVQFLNANSNYYAVLQIPDSFGLNNTAGIKLLAIEQPSISQIDYIENEIEKYVKNEQLANYKIDQNIIDKINETKVNLITTKLNLTNQKEELSNSGAATALGMGGALLIYFFIFLYGVMVMKGIIEEKTNRIVEIIISSVKPFQLMMGKILGIASVGLLQFIIWVALILLAMPLVSSFLVGNKMQELTVATTAMPANAIGNNAFLHGLLAFNYPYLIAVFIFYFITGYLFYGALFAAIGSSVDNETDTQQFMLPVTMPLVFSIALAQGLVLNAPNGLAAFWLSIIPFTSPVVMMIRLPFGVPTWELLLSMLFMILGFLFTVWLASRIYRIGILTFGKKPTYKEIWKWIRMSN